MEGTHLNQEKVVAATSELSGSTVALAREGLLELPDEYGSPIVCRCVAV